MTNFLWIEDSLNIPDRAPGCAIVWIFRMDGAAASQLLGSVRPTLADLADAARAREEAGAPRLLRRLLLRALAARLLGRHVDDIGVARTARGSLTLPGCDLHASVSGSGPFAAIALGSQPLGVDIEMLGGGAQTVEDLRRWTALEAHMKSAGAGFGDGVPDYRYTRTPDGFVFGDGPDRPGEWLCTPDFIAAAMTGSVVALAQET